jgi:hypothetical protein
VEEDRAVEDRAVEDRATAGTRETTGETTRIAGEAGIKDLPRGSGVVYFRIP